LSTDWPMQDAFCVCFLDNIFGGYHGLTIGRLALHSTVLARHAHRFSSLLEQTRIIESQEPVLWAEGQQVLDSQLMESQSIPIGISQQMLQALR
jgi:hypothetical protein